jgi:Icc-related predicted phosphoesterase
MNPVFHLGRRLSRLFFATDLHGSETCFRKFLKAAEFYKVNVLILGGDITGKMLVPIVETNQGKYRASYLDMDWEFESSEKLVGFEDKVRSAGFYPHRVTQDEMESLKADHSVVEKLFLKLMIHRLESWLSLAEENLKDKNVQCFITGGNDDPFEISDVLRKSQIVADPEDRVVRIDDSHEMISLGYSNPTPWRLPRDVPEETIAQKISEMTSGVENMSNCIFNLHVPPKDSMLDQCPLLDPSVDPPKTVTKGGQPVIAGAGSQAVLDAIQKHQPLLGLHGHIHESRAAQKFGRTVCMNPGSEYSEGILRGVIINYDEKKMLTYQFTSG